MKSAIFLGLIVPPLSLGMAGSSVYAQDYSLTPTFGEISLRSGFLPDPSWVTVQGGGEVRVAYPDTGSDQACMGFVSDAPDLRVHYENGDHSLSFSVDSIGDAILLVNDPDGVWHCSDGSNQPGPTVLFNEPFGGQYDIWVGSLLEGEVTARLSISELEAFRNDHERAFFGRDDRVHVDSAEAPWNMIGLIEGPDSICTGALVGPDIVLTAAHCTTSAHGSLSEGSFEFIAGLSGDQYLARTKVVARHIPDRWLSSPEDGFDFAFLFLAEPLGEKIGWMEIAPLSDAESRAILDGSGKKLMQGGYSSDTPFVLTANLDCPLVGIRRDNLLSHRCDTLSGDSGSPIFVEDDGRYRVIGVESYTEIRPQDRYDRNFATYSENILSEMAKVRASTTHEVGRGHVARTVSQAIWAGSS